MSGDDYELRNRLFEYHANLEEALEHDRQLQLDATWGIVKGINGSASLIGPALLIGWLDLDNIFLEVPIYMGVMFGMLLFLGNYTDKAHERDRGKLSRLPEWHKHR